MKNSIVNLQLGVVQFILTHVKIRSTLNEIRDDLCLDLINHINVQKKLGFGLCKGNKHTFFGIQHIFVAPWIRHRVSATGSLPPRPVAV